MQLFRKTRFYHGWNMIPWKWQVHSMNVSDFRGKTVGPVCFETVGIDYANYISIFKKSKGLDRHKGYSKTENKIKASLVGKCALDHGDIH